MSDKAAKTGLKFVLGLFVYGFTTLIILSALGFWWASGQFKKPSGTLSEPTLIKIERGTGLNGIARQLEKEGAIESPYIFIFGTRILGAQADLQAGEYEIQPAMSARDIMTMMRDGDTVKRRFTIREGLTSFEIVRHLNTVEGLSGEVGIIPPEGSLLPNTYDFQLDEPRTDIIARLQREMENAIFELWPTRSEGLPFSTQKEMITLASIVEKETAVPEERRRVAGVFINRLRKGIPLQTDPTVIYAITKGKHKNDGKGPLGRRLLKKDLEIDSPYNTYKNAGLPPGPIANPGLESIKAVLDPEEHDYLYFVADGSGGHAFAKTLAEHNRNVAKWRRIRATRK